MDINAALDFINSRLLANQQKGLSSLETTIFQEAWKGKEGQSYAEIGQKHSYDPASVKSAAYKLWQKLSKVCGEKVNKDNLQAVVDRLYHRINTANSIAPTPAPGDGPNVDQPGPETGLPKTLDYGPNFVGRESAIARLHQYINEGHKVIAIVAAAGIGKTTLAQQFLNHGNFDLVIPYFMAKETKDITPVETLIEEWLKQHLETEPGRDFNMTLMRLQQQLAKRRVGILIDNLEPALDEKGKFIENHRRYVDLIRILGSVSVQSVTLITSRHRLRESDLNFINYQLPELTLEAWQEYWQNSSIILEMSILTAMHTAYGGNAKVMAILKGEIQTDFAGDMAAYWRIYQSDILAKYDLKNLVASQFDKLQNSNKNAYKLLCRLGCYRYQDVPRVPHEGLLCLLWDVPEGEKTRIIESLRDRSLVEFQQGEYWLHPMIREDAISRLRHSNDWEDANRKAAEFWFNDNTKFESRNDAIIVLEAMNHYGEIVAWDKIFELLQKRVNLPSQEKVRAQLRYWGYSQEIINILQKLDNKLAPVDETERLGTIAVSYYYLGKYRSSIDILQICEQFCKNNEDYDHYSWASYYLGKNNLRLGELSKAIAYFRQGLETIDKIKNTEKYDYSCECRSFIALGSLYYDKAEYEVALSYLQKSLEILENTDICEQKYIREKGDALAYQSQCYFALNQAATAIENNKKCVALFKKIGDDISEGYAQCYLCQFYIKTQEFELANKAIEKAKNISNLVKLSSDCLLKIILLSTEALFNFYAKGDSENAIRLFKESMKISEQIGTKFELAETSYQLALTYQQMGNNVDSQTYFDLAIKLFTEMEAPKQVERVRQSMAVLTTE